MASLIVANDTSSNLKFDIKNSDGQLVSRFDLQGGSYIQYTPPDAAGRVPSNDAFELIAFSPVNGRSGTALNVTVAETRIALGESATVTQNPTGSFDFSVRLQPPEVGGPRNADAVPCYVTGTRILTDHGEVAVEHLCVGDIAVTASGVHRPIRWIGSRHTRCQGHPDPANVMPVRIAAHAIAPNVPARDLVVSPGHAIALEVYGEVLIPAAVLVNGATITQESVDSVTYWHIELDSHDLLMAENLPAESYLDMGNRGFFAEGAVVDLAATPDANPTLLSHAAFCRPFRADGVVVDMARERLRDRAVALGWHLEPASWAGAYLWADGKRIEPVIAGDRARFDFPAKAQFVWLVTDTSVPLQVGYAEDLRQLGVALTGLWLQPEGQDARAIALDHPLLERGFHAVEEAPWRWTAGFSRLPPELWAGDTGVVSLHAAMIVGGLPRWVAPGTSLLEDIAA